MEVLRLALLGIAVIGILCNGITLFCVIKKYKFTVGMNRSGLLSITVADTLFCLTNAIMIIYLGLYHRNMDPPLDVLPVRLLSVAIIFVPTLASEWSKLSFIVVMVTSLKHPFEVLSNPQWKKRICVSLVLIWILSFILSSFIAVIRHHRQLIQGLSAAWRVVIFAYLIILMIIMVLPGIVSLILLFSLCVFVYKANKTRLESSSQNEVPWVQRLNNIKFTLLKCLMISVLATVCGSPARYLITLLISLNVNVWPIWSSFTLLAVFDYLRCLTFIISPWIFALKPRETLKKVFRCRRRNEAISSQSESTEITHL